MTVSEVAVIVGWSSRRVLAWGKREKVFFKIGAMWVTTNARILLAFPDVAADYMPRERE
jgi:hypothetical protein